jgi:hypothetical protein
MLANLVKVAVPTPGTVNVGSVVALGAADTGFDTFHAAFGVGQPAYFALSDGAGRTLYGIWVTGTGAGGAPIATVQEIIWNVRTHSIAAENFTSACTAWNVTPAQRAPDKAYADSAPYRQQPRIPVSWDGNIAVVALGNFVTVTVPASTRSIVVNGRARCMGSGGSAVRDLALSAALRNPSDTADALSVNVAYAAVAPGQVVNAVVHGLSDFGGPLAENRQLVFRAQSSTSEAVQLYSLLATVECIKE